MKYLKKKLFYFFQEFLHTKKAIITQTLCYNKLKRFLDLTDYSLDYFRISSLELIANEIFSLNIQGNVAELGVYQGDFASKINKVFPDRKLYLFDTFEGFDKKDIDLEISNNFSKGDQDFSDTNVELVLNKMKYPDNCIIKKGFFPDTTKDIEDNFIFVSIDTDLYKPIYEGLKYFYPRMVKGGYIFVHDFNNDGYLGAKQAVRQFCIENGIGYFPLSDICGTAVITK